MIWYFCIIILFFIIISLSILKEQVPPAPENFEKVSSYQENKDLLAGIEKINDNLKKIDSLAYKRVKIKLKNELLEAKAKLFFKKEKDLKFVVYSVFGKQMNIESNQEEFWFSSNYVHPPIFYFCKYQDLKESNLKTPLCPEWILESMGLKKISQDNIILVKNNSKIGIKQFKTNSFGENISIVTIIDPINQVVTERYLINDKNETLASVEYKNYQSVNGIIVPNRFIISWYQENIFMEWKVYDFEVNASCPSF